MEDKKFSQINFVFVGFLATCTVFLVVGFAISKFYNFKEQKGAVVTAAPLEINNFLPEDYVDGAQKIFDNYFNRRAVLSDAFQEEGNLAWQNLIKETKTALLNLRVPTEYKDNHLQIILDLDRIENFVKQKSLNEAVTLENNLFNLSKL